jgi:hypothetical protein
MTQVGVPMRNPEIGKKFNVKLRKARNKNNLPNQILWLEQRAKDGTFDRHDAQQYENVMKLDDNLRQQCKESIRKKYAGQVPYSDVIGKDRTEIRMWKLVIKRLQNQRTDTRKIRRLMQKVSVTNALQLSMQEALNEQKTCLIRYKKNKNKAAELRKDFEHKVNTNRAIKFGTSVETQEKITKHAFKSKASFARIRKVIQKNPREAISYVEYTDKDGIEHECINKNDIDLACSQEGYRRYAQTNDTPFMTTPLLNDFGFLDNQENVDKVLAGTYECPAELDEFTQKFITELQQPENLQDLSPISGYTTTDNHIKSWKKMRVHTAASTFGPSFSEIITGTEDEAIAEIDAAIVSIAAITGYCPKRWSDAIDVMIPKKAASKHVEKLRIIVLFHALFNMLNKNVARQTMTRAKQIGAIPSEAYAKQGFRAVDCGLNKVLTADILRQQHIPAALCSNDAKQCYDRIVHAIASICLQRMGVDANTCRVMFGSLQQMQHYVKTAYGISDTSYGCIEIPLQGVLQGNGAGPAIWLLTSIPIINMLRRQGFGFKSSNLLTDENYHFAGYTYVDDTDLIHNGQRSTPPGQVFDEMQSMLDHWEGGLRATGGALVPSKSYWYGIDFKWNSRKHKWEYKSIQELPGVLTLKDHARTTTELTRLEVHEARETLGLWIAMDGNQRSQVYAIKKKIDSWADKIRTKQLTRTEAWISLRVGISKAIRYPLAATQLSKKECKSLDSRLLQTALPALGFPKTFPHAIAHAPTTALGLGIPSLWHAQGIDHIMAMLKHGDSPPTNITGCLLRDTMSTLRLELGLPGHPFQHSFQDLQHCTTHTYLHSAWEFCNDHGLVLQDNQAQLLPRRASDQFLMQAFVDNGYKNKDLRLLNLCRMWVQAITLADITTGNGLYLRSQTHNGDYLKQTIDNKEWPKGGAPDKHSWRLWETALQQCFLQPHATYKKLRQPLGTWKNLPIHWKWFHTADSDTLFEKEDTNQWRLWTRNPGHRTTRNPGYRRTLQTITTLPPSHHPTTTTGSHIKHLQGMSTIDAPTPAPTASWWYEIIDAPDTIEPILQGFRDGTAIWVADGSFKDEQGSAAFTLLPSLHAPPNTGLTLVNQTPGREDDIDAYRAEVGGIYGCVAFTNKLLTEHDIRQGKATMACDCLSALRNIFTNDYDKPSQAHYDLIHACRSLVAESPILWQERHVYGHQDTRNPFHQLDQWEQLNIEMDTLAKAQWIVHKQQQRPFFDLPSDSTWSIWHNGRRLTRWSEKTAQHLIHATTAKTYWTRKQRFQTHHLPAWDALYQAFHATNLYKKLWIPKWLTSWVPIGKKLKQWKIQTTDECPGCGEPEHHRHHVLRCKKPETIAQWDASLQKLSRWMLRNHTQPDLHHGIIEGLTAWHDQQEEPITITSTWPGVEQTFSDQANLGWHRFVDGFLTDSWISTQQSYLTFISKKTTGKRWTSRLITQLWEVAWDMWSHRKKILDTPESQSLLALMNELDLQIQSRFNKFHDRPIPAMQRWFNQPMHIVALETVDFKQQWIELVDSAWAHYT